MNGGAPATALSAVAESPVYPLRITFGWPLSRQRIRVREATGGLAMEMLVHLARPAWCEAWVGRPDGEPHFIIEAERFYTQSRTYRILEPRGELATIEYGHTVSAFEANFHLIRRGETNAAFVVRQAPAGVVGQMFPRYIVSTGGGAAVMELRLMDFWGFRRGTISRSAAPLDLRDGILCVLGLSVVGLSEFTRRLARSG